MLKLLYIRTQMILGVTDISLILWQGTAKGAIQLFAHYFM